MGRIGHIDSGSIGPPEPLLAGEKAGAGNAAILPPESDARRIDLDRVVQTPASTKNLLHGHHLHIPTNQ